MQRVFRADWHWFVWLGISGCRHGHTDRLHDCSVDTSAGADIKDSEIEEETGSVPSGQGWSQSGAGHPEVVRWQSVPEENSGEEQGGIEWGGNIIKRYCIRKESILNKNKKKEALTVFFSNYSILLYSLKLFLLLHYFHMYL